MMCCVCGVGPYSVQGWFVYERGQVWRATMVTDGVSGSFGSDVAVALCGSFVV